jgi:hypothetical protein
MTQHKQTTPIHLKLICDNYPATIGSVSVKTECNNFLSENNYPRKNHEIDYPLKKKGFYAQFHL